MEILQKKLREKEKEKWGLDLALFSKKVEKDINEQELELLE